MSKPQFELADYVQNALKGTEEMTCYFSGEESDFVRFNHAKVRQPGSVSQAYCTLRLLDGKRHASAEITLSGDPQVDKPVLKSQLGTLRELLPHLPEDPHLLINKSEKHNHNSTEQSLPKTEEMVKHIVNEAAGTDMVGILASGRIYSGFASSYGQRNWFSTSNFNLDWSLVQSTDKAVKSSYAGQEWSSVDFESRMNSAKRQLSLLSRPSKSIAPGEYRVYLTPTALGELLGTISWGGFGLQAHKSKVSSLIKLSSGEARLSDKVTLRENAGEGAASLFQSDGFLRPNTIPLITNGLHDQYLISPRSAREYGEETNGSFSSESPDSLDMAGGALPNSEVLKKLDTGLYISNLWYINYSDRSNATLTGMTRFATFWVENEEIVSPLNVMRFDDSLYRILGTELEALTTEKEFLLSAASYFNRSTDSARLPGALIRNFKFTL